MIMSYTGKGTDLSKFDRFDKNVELKSNVIELAITDDIKKYIAGYKRYSDEGTGLKQKGERIKSELNDIISALFKYEQLGKSLGDDLGAVLSKFEKSAKDLGINPTDNNDYKEGLATYKNYLAISDGFARVGENLRTIR